MSNISKICRRINFVAKNTNEKIYNYIKLLNSLPVCILLTTYDMHKFINANAAFFELFGFLNNQLDDKNIYDIITWYNQNDKKYIQDCLKNNSSIRNIETKLIVKDSKVNTFLLSADKAMIDNNEYMIFTLNDITTVRKAAENKISYLNYHDKLTGLYNRAYFEEKLKSMDNESNLPISLIIGDVNGLKSINDTLGHDKGDWLLVQVSEILKSICKSQDIISRWGEDEFAIILPNTDNTSVESICNKISDKCQICVDDLIQTSISLGYATKNDMRQDIQQVLKEAESWMYSHKLLDNRSSRSSIISSLEKTLFEKSHETKEHARRIRFVSLKLGKALGLSKKEMDDLSLLSILHDIGKIAISDTILDKPDKLTNDEWKQMRKHPEIGYRIAESSHELSHISEYILYHHERWDGTGYPRGLKGDKIPKLSRILSIADAYDVMTHSRPYKEGIMSHEEALDEIICCSGKQFDPEIADAFLKIPLR